MLKETAQSEQSHPVVYLHCSVENSEYDVLHFRGVNLRIVEQRQSSKKITAGDKRMFGNKIHIYTI